MGVLESAFSVVGTLVGVLAGFLISYYFELKRRKHELKMEYHKELQKHMDDIIKPLFVHLQNLWSSLAILQVSIRHKSLVVRGKTLKDILLETRTANQTLREFVNSKYDEMSFLLPSPFPWVFAPFDELVESRIVEPILQGKEPTDDITLAVNTAMKIQKNLRRLIGFETDVEIETIYPFKKDNSRRKDTDEAKKEHKLWYLGIATSLSGSLLIACAVQSVNSSGLLKVLWTIFYILAGIFFFETSENAGEIMGVSRYYIKGLKIAMITIVVSGLVGILLTEILLK